MQLRSYQPEDLDALYAICLETGDSGQDATRLYRDPKLLGHRYAAPYAVYEPELCFVLEDAEGVCGYILGAADSTAFYAWYESVWTPSLRERYPEPKGDPEAWTHDEQAVRLLYDVPRVRAGLEPYPAHLHIDLLPRAQGQGQGRRLMAVFLEKLRELQISGVHLGTSAANRRAIGFYRHLGFETFEDNRHGVIFVMKLAVEKPSPSP